MRLIPLFLLLACGPQTADTGPATTSGTPGGTTASTTTLRVMTWNIESVGQPGDIDHDSLVAILDRIDADIVGLNEVDGTEEDELEQIAAELGYDTVIIPTTNPFGDLKNAMLARVPIVDSTIHRSAGLSGDPDANDVTRRPISVTLEGGLTIAVQHCKSGFDDEDEFRRTVDAIRTTQVAGADTSMLVLMGDMNQEVDEPQDTPETFTDFPYGMPGSYFLGEDLYTELTGPGLHNGPFPHFADAGLTVVEAAQLDGDLATRPSSGRRIDYVLVGSGLVGAVSAAEIYDARDDGNGDGLPKAGVPPQRSASERASDHLPVVIELTY